MVAMNDLLNLDEKLVLPVYRPAMPGTRHLFLDDTMPCTDSGLIGYDFTGDSAVFCLGNKAFADKIMRRGVRPAVHDVLSTETGDAGQRCQLIGAGRVDIDCVSGGGGFRVAVQTFLHASGNIVDLALGIGGCDLGVCGGLLGSLLHLLGGFRSLVLHLLIRGRRAVVTSGEPYQGNDGRQRCPSASTD